MRVLDIRAELLLLLSSGYFLTALVVLNYDNMLLFMILKCNNYFILGIFSKN